jgi:O-antigen/teichoic acid export membrane protein
MNADDRTDRAPPPVRRPSSASGGKETLIVFATQLWGLAVGLGTQSVLAWMLAPAGRGEYAVCMLFGGIFGVIFTLGTDRAAQYFVMSKEQSLPQALSVAIITAVSGCALAMVIGFALIHSPISFFHKADTAAFVIALALIPLTVLNTTLCLQLAGLRRFARLGLVGILQTSSTLAFIVALVSVFNLGVHGALLAQVASSLLALWLLFWDLRTLCGFRLILPRWPDFRQILFYGSRYYFARIGDMIGSGLGMFIVAMFATREEIGLLAAASALILKVLVFSDSVEATLLPRIAADPAGRTELVEQCVRLSGLFTGVTVAGIVTLSFPLVSVLLSPQFIPAVPLLWILAPGVVIFGGSQILMGFFRGTGRPGVCSLVVWVGLVSNVLALVVLFPLIGLPAAAWAMTISYASRAIVLFESYRRVSGQRAFDVLRFQRTDLSAMKSLLRGVYGKFFPAYHG